MHGALQPDFSHLELQPLLQADPNPAPPSGPHPVPAPAQVLGPQLQGDSTLHSKIQTPTMEHVLCGLGQALYHGE